METSVAAYRISNYSLPGNLNWCVVRCILSASRGGSRIRSVLAYRLTKTVSLSPDIGHVVRETQDKIVVFGEQNTRYEYQKKKSK
jgi:hypothetical protein